VTGEGNGDGDDSRLVIRLDAVRPDPDNPGAWRPQIYEAPDGWLDLPSPKPGGEPLVGYLERVITNDSFLGSVPSLPAWGPPSLNGKRPADLTRQWWAKEWPDKIFYRLYEEYPRNYHRDRVYWRLVVAIIDRIRAGDFMLKGRRMDVPTETLEPEPIKRERLLDRFMVLRPQAQDGGWFRPEAWHGNEPPPGLERYCDLTLWPAEAAETKSIVPPAADVDVPAVPPQRPRRRAGLDYRADDDALGAEILEGVNFSTPSASALSPDPARGLTPAQALRHPDYNSAADVAEFERLANEAEAELAAMDCSAARIEADMVAASREAAMGRDVADRLERLKKALEQATADAAMALTRLETPRLKQDRNGVELGDCTRRLWQHVRDLGADSHVRITWQPSDPMLPRQTVPPDRCRHLGVAYPGVLWGGTPALDALALRCFGRLVLPGGVASGPPRGPDTLRLDGHFLPRALIFPAAEPEPAKARETLLPAPEPDTQQTVNPATKRQASEDDLDAGIRWSAARKDDGLPRWRKGRKPDGLTSRNQLRDDAPTWCELNNVVYGKGGDWEHRLNSHHSGLKRAGRPKRQ
jgi:hypothetical protein